MLTDDSLVIYLTLVYIFLFNYGRNLESFLLSGCFIICTCLSVTPCVWQAVTAMSGMSALSVLIVSVASGDGEAGKRKGRASMVDGTEK